MRLLPPGNDDTHTSFPGGDVPPAGDALRATMPSARLPGVAPAPRLQPPANKRERLRRTPNALRAFPPHPPPAQPGSTGGRDGHRSTGVWVPARDGTCGAQACDATGKAIARSAYSAPEALSFVSRGLVARCASYPRKRRHPHALPRRGCPTCLSQHTTCGRCPPGNDAIGAPTGGSTRSAVATPG